jgi:hypothetical protein
MSIAAISSGNVLNQASTSQNANKPQGTEFQQLTQALQSGNLTNAQQLFSALNNSSTSSNLLSAQIKQELGNLGSALQSGDLAGARQAYSSVQQNLQSPSHIAAHHNRPVHGGGGIGSTTSGFPATNGSAGGGTSALNDIFQALSLIA